MLLESTRRSVAQPLQIGERVFRRGRTGEVVVPRRRFVNPPTTAAGNPSLEMRGKRTMKIRAPVERQCDGSCRARDCLRIQPYVVGVKEYPRHGMRSSIQRRAGLEGVRISGNLLMKTAKPAFVRCEQGHSADDRREDASALDIGNQHQR